MTEEEKQPTLWQTYKHYSRQIPAIRWAAWSIVVAIVLSLSFNVYNAVLVYQDWRCLTADCKILQNGDKELLLIGDEDL